MLSEGYANNWLIGGKWFYSNATVLVIKKKKVLTHSYFYNAFTTLPVVEW